MADRLNAFEMSPEHVARATEAIQRRIYRDTDGFFRELCLDEYGNGRAGRWHRDYSSLEAYEASVEPNRRRLEDLLGGYDSTVDDPEPATIPFMENDCLRGEWLSIKIAGELRGWALFALPKRGDGPFPLVVCQHGYSMGPETCFGLGDPACMHHELGQRLVENGYAVLAPYNVLQGRPRARFHRQGSLIGKTLFGLETFRTRRLLDHLTARPDIDGNRIAMWGLSLGGPATLFTAALDKRVRAALVACWFSKRLERFITEIPQRASYLVEDVGEHLYLHGWMLEFGDADLVSLICPRATQIQTSYGDTSVWWRSAVEEFGAARAHYEKLGLGGHCEQAMHELGHEVNLEAGLAFIDRHLSGDQ